MSELIKLSKAWAVAAIASKVVGSVAILAGVVVLALALGEGGVFTVAWQPGGNP